MLQPAVWLTGWKVWVTRAYGSILRYIYLYQGSLAFPFLAILGHFSTLWKPTQWVPKWVPVIEKWEKIHLYNSSRNKSLY